MTTIGRSVQLLSLHTSVCASVFRQLLTCGVPRGQKEVGMKSLATHTKNLATTHTHHAAQQTQQADLLTLKWCFEREKTFFVLFSCFFCFLERHTLLLCASDSTVVSLLISPVGSCLAVGDQVNPNPRMVLCVREDLMCVGFLFLLFA